MFYKKIFVFSCLICLLGACSEGVKRRVLNQENQAVFDVWWIFDQENNPKPGPKLMNCYFSRDGQYQSSGGETGTWVWTVAQTMKISTEEQTWLIEFTHIDSNEMRCLFGQAKQEYRFKAKRNELQDNH